MIYNDEDAEAKAKKQKEDLISSVDMKTRIKALKTVKSSFPAFDINNVVCDCFFTPSELLSDEFVSKYDYDDDPAGLLPKDRKLVDSVTGEVAPDDVAGNPTNRVLTLIGAIKTIGLDKAQDYNIVKKDSDLRLIYSTMEKLNDGEIKYLKAYDAYSWHNGIAKARSENGGYSCYFNYHSIEHVLKYAISMRFLDKENEILDSILSGTFDKTASIFSKYDDFYRDLFLNDSMASEINSTVRAIYEKALSFMYSKRSTDDIKKITDYLKTGKGKAQYDEFTLEPFLEVPNTMFLNPKLTDDEIASVIEDKFFNNKGVDYAVGMLNDSFSEGKINITDLGALLKRCVIDNKHARDNYFKEKKSRLVHRALSISLFGKVTTRNSIDYKTKYSGDEKFVKFKEFVTEYKDYIFDYEWLASLVQYVSFTSGYYGTDYDNNVIGFLKLLCKYRAQDPDKDYYLSRFVETAAKVINHNFFPTGEETKESELTTAQGITMSSISLGALFFIENSLTASSFDRNIQSAYHFGFDKSGAMRDVIAYIVKNRNGEGFLKGVPADKRSKVVASIITAGLFDELDANDYINSDVHDDTIGEKTNFNRFCGDYILYIGEDIRPGKFDDGEYYRTSFRNYGMCDRIERLSKFYTGMHDRLDRYLCITKEKSERKEIQPYDEISEADAKAFKDEIIPEIKYVLNRKGETVFSFVKSTTVLCLDELRILSDLYNLSQGPCEGHLFEAGDVPSSLIVIPACSAQDMQKKEDAEEYVANMLSAKTDKTVDFIKNALLGTWLIPNYDADVMDKVINLDLIVNYSNHQGNKEFKEWENDSVYSSNNPCTFDENGKSIILESRYEYLYPNTNSYGNQINSTSTNGIVMNSVYKFLMDATIPCLEKKGLITPEQKREANSNCYDAMNSYLMMTNSVFQK